MTYISIRGGGGGDYTLGDRPSLLQGLHIYLKQKNNACIQEKKDIYGTLEASLPFWEKLSKILEEMSYRRKNIIGVL